MQSFMAKRVSWIYSFELSHGIKQVFPLFTPKEEKKWAKGWDFEAVFPLPYCIEENSIFKTWTHDHKNEEAIWIINKYQPEKYHIEYIRFEPAKKIGHIQITCQSKGRNRTEISVTYTYTGLNDVGNIFIEGFREDEYKKYITEWERALSHYLQTGDMLE